MKWKLEIKLNLKQSLSCGDKEKMMNWNFERSKKSKNHKFEKVEVDDQNLQ